MNPADYEFQSEFARRYFSQGKTEGKAEGKVELLVRLATLKFGPVSEVLQGRIRAATAAELDQMGERLLSATTLEEVLSTADGSSR